MSAVFQDGGTYAVAQAGVPLAFERLYGAFRVVETGPRRAGIAFAPRGAIAEAYPGLDADDMPERGGAGLVLRTALTRPPAVATGCALVFTTDR